MTLKKLFNLLASLLLAVTFTSCLGDDDNNINTGTSTGQLFASVEAYSTSSVSFTVYLPNDNYPYTLVSPLSPKISETEYPVGSRVFITYSVKNGQDVSLPINIELMSIGKVSIANVENATTEQCKMEYPYIIMGNATYIGGGYVNFITSVQQAASRTWKAYLNTETSTSENAEIYVITEATDAKAERTNVGVSINVASLLSRYSRLHLHFKTQYDDDQVVTLQVPSQSNN